MRAILVVLVALSFAPLAGATPPQTSSPMILAPLGDSPQDIRATLELPAATWYNDKDGDKIFDSLEQLLVGQAVVPVIVTLVDGADVEGALAKAQLLAKFEPSYVYNFVGGFSATLDAAQVAKIATLAEVRQIEYSQPGEPELDTATYAMGVDAVQDGLGIDGDLDGSSDFTGQDVTIGIMDTGFNGAHVDLKDKFLAFIDWPNGGAETEPYDSGSHGTHVASIAGGLGIADERYKGVAPGAAFVGFQISGGDTKANAIASMDWMIENREKYNIRVSTISFGFGTTVDGTDALELAMDRAWEAGIMNFKSTGNSGNERGTVTIPGGARGILSIANLVDPGHNGFHLSSSSSRGPTEDGRAKPDLAAPGSSIMAANAATTDGYVSLSGTSMASPHAAGVAALLFAADPTLSNDAAKAILIATAHDWGEPGHDIDYGWGRIDALRAVQTALVDRAIREAWPAEQLLGLNVTPPNNPWHNSIVVSASLSDGLVENAFTVVTPGQPVAATFIANGTSPVAAADTARMIIVEVLNPSGTVIGTVSVSPISRQQAVTFPTGEVGDYSLRFLNLIGGEVMFVDFSAGLLPEVLAPLIPEPGEFIEAVAKSQPLAATEPIEEEAPALLWLAPLLIAALVRRYQRL